MSTWFVESVYSGSGNESRAAIFLKTNAVDLRTLCFAYHFSMQKVYDTMTELVFQKQIYQFEKERAA